MSFSSSLSEKKISSAADCIYTMVGQQLRSDLLNEMHLHEIFTLQCVHQKLLVDYGLLSLSSPPMWRLFRSEIKSELLSESCPF